MLRSSEQQSSPNGHFRIRVSLPASAPSHKKHPTLPERKQTYTKVFRWRVPTGRMPAPVSVEIAGSFTDWERVPLAREKEAGVWTVTLENIPTNRTHHYMLLADGKPVSDENADGLAGPQGPQEEQYQLHTHRGGRVFILYAQAK